MARPLILLVVLSLAIPASPASAQIPDIQEDRIAWNLTPRLRASMLKSAAATRAKLAVRINFEGIANPKTSLGDALDLLQKQSGIPLEVNYGAFRDEGRRGRTQPAHRSSHPEDARCASVHSA
jgi:hypothetical protein